MIYIDTGRSNVQMLGKITFDKRKTDKETVSLNLND